MSVYRIGCLIKRCPLRKLPKVVCLAGSRISSEVGCLRGEAADHGASRSEVAGFVGLGGGQLAELQAPPCSVGGHVGLPC